MLNLQKGGSGFANVACAYVTCRHYAGIIRVTSRWIQVQHHSGGDCAAARCDRLAKECRKQEWCQSEGIGVITAVSRWIPGK